MATTLLSGSATTAGGAIAAMQVAVNAIGTSINVGHAHGIVKVGSGEWYYYYIYN
jgi:hypothetical protein